MIKTDIEFELEKQEFADVMEHTLHDAIECSITNRSVIENGSRALLIAYITRDYLDPRHRYPIYRILELEEIRNKMVAEYFAKGGNDEK